MEDRKYKKGKKNNKKNKIGLWSKEEHNIFIQSLFLYGNGWKKVFFILFIIFIYLYFIYCHFRLVNFFL